MTSFEFATDERILFGPGTLQQAGDLAANFGSRALVVVGAHVKRAQPLFSLLDERGIGRVIFSVTDEPTVAVARSGLTLARERDCDFVIGYGGGSVIDVGKAIAALLTNEGDLFDYLEVIGQGQPLRNRAAPYIAIPTTAGTGSEVTRNAVLSSPEHRVKVSLRSPLMLPRVAIVDPELTHSMPPRVTAFTGMDALVQVLEPLVSNRANPLTDAICREGLMRAARSLRRAYEDGNDAAAREEMALASLCGGLALANAGLGAVHGFAGPFGGMFHSPHGAVCAALLPPVMRINVEALRRRAPDHPALARYAEIARILTGDPKAGIQDGVAWVRELAAALRIPPLSTYGFTEADFPDLMARAVRSSSMKGNPVALDEGEMRAVLERATVQPTLSK